MIIEEFFKNEFYPTIKENLKSDDYKIEVVKSDQLYSEIFPIVTMKVLPSTQEYIDLSYNAENYNFSIEMNIYTQDMIINEKKVSKAIICDDIMSEIERIIKSNYRFKFRYYRNNVNLDTSVYRNTIIINSNIIKQENVEDYIIKPLN